MKIISGNKYNKPSDIAAKFKRDIEVSIISNCI